MKSVLEIIGKLYIGGAEKVARDIGYYADPQKYQVDYVVFEDIVGAYEPELLEKGCRIFHLAPPASGYRAYMAALKKLIRENRYDVIHCHTMFSSGWPMLAGKLWGVPVRITHSHSIRGFEKRGLLKTIYEKTMRCVILACSTHCVGCGQKAGKWLFGDKAYADRGITILNGIDTTRFAFREEYRQDIRKSLNLEDAFIIGHVGHLAQVKNQRFLIDLMPEILKEKENAVLLLLGDGADKQMLLDRAAELGLSDKVILTGNVPDVHRYLSAMDVFAFPSLYEGTPLSVVEVQANGLPCVLSDQVPKDVYLTDLVTPLPLEQKNAWLETICNTQRKQPEKYGPILGKSEFNRDVMLKKIYALYESR